MINPEQAKIVKQIFEMYGVERLSMNAIARYLNCLGSPAIEVSCALR
jgi:hypothetical protein